MEGVRRVINRLKVMELVRYNINTNLNSLQEKALQDNGDTTVDTVSAVFSTGLSLIVCQFGDSLYSLIRDFVSAPGWLRKSSVSIQNLVHSVLEGFLVFVLFIVGFNVSFRIFHKWFERRRRIKYAKRSGSITRSLAEYKKIIDDFDHIVCDAILFSQYFIYAYNKSKKRKQKVSENDRFNVYEAIYYLIKAETITKDVFLHSEHCITSSDTTDRISIHRLENMVLLMEEIQQKLKIIVDEIKLDMNQISQNSLTTSFDNVNELTTDLRTMLDQLLKTPS